MIPGYILFTEAILGPLFWILVVLFSSNGVLSGQSQPHSHTQLVGSRVVPYYMRSLLHEAERHFDSFGACVFCELLRYETEQQKRIIYQNSSYISFVPFAAGAEHETWILPKFHSANIEELDDKKLNDLADILKNIFCRFQTAVEKPDFNFFVRTAPYPLSSLPFYHWHIQLLPRTKIVGGFEFATRIPVNTILPEMSAQLLRECRLC